MSNDEFDRLLERVLDPAFRLAMTMLNDGTAAEDAVEEAAHKAWRNLHRFRYAWRARWWRVEHWTDIVRRRARGDRWVDRIDLDTALERPAPHRAPAALRPGILLEFNG